jgi:hypothetical protein
MRPHLCRAPRLLLSALRSSPQCDSNDMLADEETIRWPEVADCWSKQCCHPLQRHAATSSIRQESVIYAEGVTERLLTGN